MLAPDVLVLGRFVASWPAREADKRPPVVKRWPLDRALTRPYHMDAHFAAYEASMPYRLNGLVLEHDLLRAGVSMRLALFDVDAPGHGDEPASDDWWQRTRSKIESLLAQHPDAYVYRTRGGARIVYALDPPVVLVTVDDAEAWKQRYLDWCQYLEQRFDIAADPACKDWTRLYRCPRASRDGSASPEDRETIGDPHNIGTWTLPADWVPAPRESTNGPTSHYQAPDRVPRGARHADAVSLAGQLRRGGMDDARVYGMLRERRDNHYEDPGSMLDRELAEIAKWVERKKPAASSESVDLERFVSADMGWNDLLKLELPPVRALLAGTDGDVLLPAASFSIWHGDGGVGKTFTLLGAARAWSLGLPWLGLTTIAGGVAVGYLSLELPLHELQSRAARHGDGSRVRLISRPQLKGAVNLNGTDREALKRWIERRGLEVVVIDALQRVHAGDETREDVAPLLEWMHELAAETGCAIVLLHHDRKPSDSNGKTVADDPHTARGSTVIETTPGVRVHLYRYADCRVLKWRKNWFGLEPVIYTRLDSPNGVPVACEAPETASKARGAKTRDLVAQAMRDGITDPDEIAKRVGKGRSTVFGHMKAVRQSDQSSLPILD